MFLELFQKGNEMNWDQVAGKWQEVKGKVRQQWGKLTDDDLTKVNGKREELAGVIRTRYGVAKEEADKQIDEFCKTCR